MILVYSQAITETITQRILASAFEACGICPFDSERLDYSKLLTNVKVGPSPSGSSVSSCPCATCPEAAFLERIEEKIGDERLLQFYKIGPNDMPAEKADESLFIIWKSARLEANLEKQRNISLLPIDAEENENVVSQENETVVPEENESSDKVNVPVAVTFATD